MLPQDMRQRLLEKIAGAESRREQAVDVMLEFQGYYGYMSNEAMREASELLGMSPLELDELATFYDHIYREPVGKYIIHVCDSAVCWMQGHLKLLDYLSRSLAIDIGGTTADGLFTLLPVVCIGYCDRAPAMLINNSVYGMLTPAKIDRILHKLRTNSEFPKAE